MIDRVLHLLRKEFIQLFRDPRTRVIVFGMPVFQLIIFGYVVNTDVNNVRFVVLDQDKTPESRQLIQRFEASRYFTLRHDAANLGEMEQLLLGEKVALALHIPHGYGGRLARGGQAALLSFVDGSISNIAAVVAGYATAVVEQHSAGITLERLKMAGTNAPLQPGGVDLRVRAWYNADLESRNFYLPGVVAFLVMLISLLLTSMALVREKELGTMEQLVVTPIRPLEMILGKTLPYAAVGFVDMLLVVGVAVLWFDIPVRGSLALLLGGGVLFIATALGIGLFISTISGTMQQAMMTTFFILNPLFLLSGLAFPIQDMPLPIQYVTVLNPLNHFLVVVRGIFLRGIGLELLWPQFAALAAIALAVLTASTLRFRKRLE